MTKPDELELFDYLSRTKLREWLEAQLAAEISVLTQALDIDQLRKAQGRAGLLTSMRVLLDSCKPNTGYPAWSRYMALPNQVQAALDAADATLAAANAGNGEQPAEDVFAAAEQPQPEPQVEQPQPVAPEPQPVVRDEPWEQRYSVLRGKYDSEVPQLHKRVHALESDLQAAIARLDQATQAQQAPAKHAVDPKDVENFGEDLVSMVDRVAKTSMSQAAKDFAAKTAAMEAQIAAMTEQLKGTSTQLAVTAEQSFFDRLSKEVPSWAQINADKGFLSWLAEADPVYGVPRQQALAAAQQRLDADRVAAVFRAYTGPAKPQLKADPLASMVSPKGA